jgi:hypothetical protein
MSEHPLMALLLETNTFLGQAEMVENTIMPLDNQLTFGVDDCAILAGSNIPLERDFVLVRGLDPEKHAEAFPDWEDRMLNSYVLCEIFSRADPDISIGWISRLKLMRIPKYRYKEARRWMKDGFPDQLPDWAGVAYRKYTDALAERAPEVVPLQVTCPNCHRREVELLVVRRIEYRVNAGQVKVGEGQRYVPLHPPEEKDSHTARLHCRKCDSTAELTDEEWQFPDITN